MKSTHVSSSHVRLAAPAAAALSLTRRFALAVVMFGGLAACGGEEPSSRPPPSQPTSYTCTASITPSSFEYSVAGDVLHVITPGQIEQFERVASGDPSNPVFGTWHLGTQTNPIATTTLDMEIGPDQVTAIADCDFGRVSAIAEASAPAVITDTSVTILDSAEDVEVVYGD